MDSLKSFLNDPETALSLMLFCLVLEAVLLPLTFIAAFARDIAMKQPIAREET